MIPEHGTGGRSVVHAPSPDWLLVWCVITCGCFRWFTSPPCFTEQPVIDAWFEQRRGSAAAQMEAAGG